MISLPRRILAAIVAAALGTLSAFVSLVLVYLPATTIPWSAFGLGYAAPVLFLLLTVAALVGSLASRLGAFLVGFIAAAAAAYTGASIILALSEPGGQNFILTAIIDDPVFWYLALPFPLGAALGWATVGRFYARAVLSPPVLVDEPRTVPPVAIVPRHAESAEGVGAHRELLREYGWLAVDAARDSDLDAAIVRLGPDVMVKHESATLFGTGLHLVRLSERARLDARDIVVTGTTVLVSPSDGTDSAGIAELRAAANDRGFGVRVLRTYAGEHLAEVALALPDGTVLVRAGTVAEPAVIPAARIRREVCIPFGFVLDAHTVGVPQDAIETTAAITELGFHVVPLLGDSGIRLVG